MHDDEARIGRHIIRKSSPVRVHGKHGTWTVVSIGDGDDPAVEVVHAENGRSRIFRLSTLIYVAPSSKRGRAAALDRDGARLIVNVLAPAKPIRRRAPRKRATG